MDRTVTIESPGDNAKVTFAMKFPSLQCRTLNFLVLLTSLFLCARSLRNEEFQSEKPNSKYDSIGFESSGIRQLKEIRSREAGESPAPFEFPRFVPKNSPPKTGWPWNFGRKSGGQSDATTSKPIPLDEKGRIMMGVSSKDCDDGKTHLERDWDGSPINYTCFHPESPYPEDSRTPPLLECVTLPKDYTPKHFCMSDSIVYDDPIPTYGDHRPIWPIFGEYRFVPTQRWLHNIEHGAVVMLYHPCTHPEEVKRLRRIVRKCYGKHVITPSTFVPKDRPMALVAWGCRYLMANVDEVEVIKFIKQRGMKGPEGLYTKEGTYDFGLIRSANETEGARYDKITCDIPPTY